MEMDLITKIYTNPKYKRLILNTIYFITKRTIPHHDLEDCVEDVYQIAVEQREKLEKHPNVEGWLVLTAQNIAKQYIGRKVIGNIVTGIDDKLVYLTDKSAEDLRQYKETLDFIESSLKRKEHNLFVLKFLDKLAAEEIAGRMDMSINAVESRIKRLRKKLKDILK